MNILLSLVASIGYAMSVAAWVSFLVSLFYCLLLPEVKSIQIMKFWKGYDKQHFTHLLKLGFPIGLAMALDACILSLTVFFLGKIHHQAMSAYQITQQLQFIPLMFPIGIGQGSTVMASQYIGANEFHKLRKTMYLVLAVSIGIMLCFSIPYFLIPDFFIKLFIGNHDYQLESQVVKLATQFIMIMAVFNIFDAIRLSGTGFLRGLKDVKWPLYISLIWFWASYIILTLIFAFWLKLGVLAVWGSAAVSVIGAGLTVWWRMQYKIRRVLR